MLEIDFWSILFTVINLLILFVAMKLFLFKPVKNIIAKRQEEADAAALEAEARAAEADKSKAEYEKAVAKTEAEREQILTEARKQADEEYQKTLAEARSEAEIIKKEASTEGEKRKQRIISEAGKEIGDMIASATTKILGNVEESDLYDAFLNTMEDEQ
ncbi:MAG: ATP synthase F0 subunit B [Lachnospiraceae bacterium]|nr:ATP synthase F0 subunit B [Lachnospiraceae bacterium]